MTVTQAPARSRRASARRWSPGWCSPAALMWPLRDYITDDTFIHLQVRAPSRAGRRARCSTSASASTACTSPLWVALLGDAMALGLDGLAAAKAIGVLADPGVGRAVPPAPAPHARASPSLRAVATLAWAAHAWMMRWSISGMETPLAVVLTLAGFVAFTASEPWGARPVRTGRCWALAALTRPEAWCCSCSGAVLLLLGWPATAAALRRLAVRRRGHRCSHGGWLAFARAYYGTFWPQTLAAKAAGGAGLAVPRCEILWRQVRIIGAHRAPSRGRDAGAGH